MSDHFRKNLTEAQMTDHDTACDACAGRLSDEQWEALKKTATDSHAKVHVSFTKGPFQVPHDEIVFGGESPWAKRTSDPFLFVIDNLLFATTVVGHLDWVRVEVGDFGEYEVVEVVNSHPCFRGALDYGGELETVKALIKDLREEFSDEEVQTEGGFGALTWQCEPDVIERVVAFFESHPSVVEYDYHASPALIATMERVEGES